MSGENVNERSNGRGLCFSGGALVEDPRAPRALKVPESAHNAIVTGHAEGFARQRF